MIGSLSKYWKQNQDTRGNQLHWPGTIDGYPVRGQATPVTSQNEFENIPLVYDAKGKYFILPDDLTEYLDVIDRCANGWYQLRHERFLGFDPETKKETVFLQWLEIHGEIPDAKSAPKFN